MARAKPHIQLVMEQMEIVLTALIASGESLSFMVSEPKPVDLLSDKPETEPNVAFKRYHIVLYTPENSVSEEPRIGGHVLRNYNIGIALFRKITRSSRKRMFSNLSDDYGGVGIYEFQNYVMDALRDQTFGGLVNLTSSGQFNTLEKADTGENFLERVDMIHSSEQLHSKDADGVP